MSLYIDGFHKRTYNKKTKKIQIMMIPLHNDHNQHETFCRSRPTERYLIYDKLQGAACGSQYESYKEY